MLQKFVLGVSVAAAVGGTPAHAQEQAPVFRSGVAVVPISAVVRDERGRTITTLKPTDFEVRDNGERRRILTFQMDETTPLTVAVLVDMSGSMRLESKLAAAREVVEEIAMNLRPEIDAVGLFTFDSELRQAHDFTAYPASVGGQLADVAPFGATSLYDAIAETARRLADQPSTRRAIVVLTDAVDTSSALDPSEVSARASAMDVPVYIVATVTGIDKSTYVARAANPNARSTADARDLALWTGGDLLWASGAGAGTSAARAILTELRHQYLIAVDSAADGAWRRLEVRVRNPRLTVRARSGYFGR
jgi:Ca-activated chloride channel homolog